MKITGKKVISSAIALAVSATALFTPATAQAGKVSCIVNGTIKNDHGEPMPSMIYLYHLNKGLLNSTAYKLDSATIVNGTYHFKASIDEPVTVLLCIGELQIPGNGLRVKNSVARLWLDEGVINIVSDPSFKNMAVTGTGSRFHRDYDEANIHTKHYVDSLQALSETAAFETDEVFKENVRAAFSMFGGMAAKEQYAFVKKHPESPIAPMVLEFLANPLGLQLSGLTPEEVESLLATLPPPSRALAKKKIADNLEKAKETEVAKKAIEAKTAVGVMAADFTQNDVNGKAVKLSSFRGKYVLVDFWASWCKPCRAENPNVVKAYNQYKDKGLAILGVSLDFESGHDAWLAAIQKDGLVWTQVSDLKGFKNEAALLYNVNAIPQNFLLDPGGKIIAKNLRGEDLDKKLSEIFAASPSNP